jgi:hypothetical protein
MDDLTTFSPCLCAACGEIVMTQHDCTPPRRSVLEGVVMLGKRRQLIATMARRKRRAL